MAVGVLKQIYRRQQFSPGPLGMVLNPFYFTRRGLFESMIKFGSRVQGRVLDVGCGNKPYQKMFNATEYVGLEIDSPENRAKKNADHFYDGNTFPFEASAFDTVIANEVFEHVFNPANFLSEMRRVLRPGGTLLMTMPFAWDEHEQPYDYARYTSFGIRHLLESAGFEAVEVNKTVPDIRAVFQILNCYIYKACLTKNAKLNIIIGIVLIAPFNLLGSFVNLFLPSNPDYYLNNVVLARRSG